MSSHATNAPTTTDLGRPAQPTGGQLARHRTLDGFVEAVSQADGIGLIDVDVFTTLVVQTDNSVYQITILRPHAREVFGPGWRVLPRTDACVSERIELWR